MGTDINIVAQAKIGGVWVDIESNIDERRHYKLFAHLAGVRNSEEVKPIQEGRGFPEDFPIDTSDYGERHNGHWMGYHSYGWVSAIEVLNHDWGQGVSRGIISLEEYRKWDGNEPDGYYKMILGEDVFVYDDCDNLPECTTHVLVTWKNTPDMFDYFVDGVAKLVADYGDDVRIVFGFDI